jgi:hypothetical protein
MGRTLRAALATKGLNIAVRQSLGGFATRAHLLLALIDGVDASAVMKACKVDLGALKERLTNLYRQRAEKLVIADGGEPKQTRGFQRVVQCAPHYAQGRGLCPGLGGVA